MPKIAISLPGDLFEAIERERKACGLTRSAFLRRAVEALLRRERQRELEEQYVRGYLENPETPEEAEDLYRASLEALAEEPWDEGDDQ